MTATTNWVPIYGYEDSYEISSNAEVRAIGATTIRSNGRTYTSKRKMLKQQINNESVIDTLLDLANYSIMLAMEIKNNDFTNVK